MLSHLTVHFLDLSTIVDVLPEDAATISCCVWATAVDAAIQAPVWTRCDGWVGTFATTRKHTVFWPCVGTSAPWTDRSHGTTALVRMAKATASVAEGGPCSTFSRSTNDDADPVKNGDLLVNEFGRCKSRLGVPNLEINSRLRRLICNSCDSRRPCQLLVKNLTHRRVAHCFEDILRGRGICWHRRYTRVPKCRGLNNFQV